MPADRSPVPPPTQPDAEAGRQPMRGEPKQPSGPSGEQAPVVADLRSISTAVPVLVRVASSGQAALGRVHNRRLAERIRLLQQRDRQLRARVRTS